MPDLDSPQVPTILTPEAFCFILDRDNDSRLEFQLMPQNIAESKAAIYNEIPIIGRSLPLLGYSGSSSRTMGLAIQFAALNENLGGLQSPTKYSADWVINRVRWLESKVYPEYVGGYVHPPPRLTVIIGEALGMDCVMTNVSTTWEGPWAVSGPRATAFRAQVDCTFQEYGMNMQRGYPFSHSDAIIGDNQAIGGGTGGSAYIELPLRVTEVAGGE